ncbi:SipW-dependent-type signal peptide-containing protein [Haloglomus litoreum]|uniref:SipW-dependent-type signal peptide-containing protein n=1 Tax=Haloglomus litoreum TaxID=3034026 RepID=UPI0023E7FF9A|nr:SipW-dependent-type signal peptide-containing protein [Haloglomus sp. DT116]
MSDKRYQLTRRKALAGLATVGVAGAGAGLGTSALFNDTESFEENMMTAGELDLAVDYVVHEDQGMAGSYTINSFTETVNGSSADVPTVNGDGTSMSQDLDDIKPGDSGHSYFCFTIDDNPAYMWACGELTGTAEQGPGGDGPYTEPEPQDNNGEGELEENIDVTMSYCDIDESDGSLNSTGAEIFSGSLRELLTALQAGIPLDGTGVANPTPGSQAAYDGTTNSTGNSDVTNPCICFEWEVPISVENIIQGDTLSFDLSFYAEQARHNDGSENPCKDESYSADYVNPDGIDQPIPDGVLNVDVAYGAEQVVYCIEFDEPADSEYSLADPGFASTSFSIAFNADSEDDDIYDFQLAWDPDGGFPDSPFGYSAVDEAVPEWVKDTSAGWSALPSGFSMSKSGNMFTVVVPRSALDKGTTDEYKFGVNASAGGEQPYVSIPTSGVYSGDDNFTSDNNNGLTTTLP